MKKNLGNPEVCPRCEYDLVRAKEQLPGLDVLSFCPKCQLPLTLIAGKYQLKEAIGEGSGGTVYLAHHVRMSRDPERVVKILRPELFKLDGMEARFEREVQVTSSISMRNEHIVRVFDDFGEEPQIGFFYVMEYLQGHTLGKLLKEPQDLPSLSTCLHIFEQLCDAMEAAHKEEIIHRDLKPENIHLIKRDDDPFFVKVIDFGIAKPVDAESLKITNLTQGPLGTPYYMSPEQCSAKGVSAASDIYSMGIILFEMLTGKTPFSSLGGAMATLEIAMAHMSSQPPNPRSMRPDREIPPALAQAVLRALEKEPAQRFPSAKAFWEALAPIATQIKSGPPSYVSQPPAETDKQETPRQDEQVFESQEFASDEFLRPDSFSSKQSGELYVEEDEFLRAPATPEPVPSPSPPPASSSDFSNALSGPTLVGAQVDLSNYQPVDNRATREDAELAEALLEVARQQAAQEHVGITPQEFDELGDSDPFEQTTPGNTLSPFAGHPDPFKTVNEGELSPVKPISSPSAGTNKWIAIASSAIAIATIGFLIFWLLRR